MRPYFCVAQQHDPALRTGNHVDGSIGTCCELLGSHRIVEDSVGVFPVFFPGVSRVAAHRFSGVPTQ